MQIIQNIKDLDKAFEPYLEKAMILTRDEIFEVVSRKVSDYYNEPVFNDPDPTEPDYYNRTGTLMESLTASHVTKSGNSMEFRVGWDDEYISYTYPGWKRRWGRGLAGKNYATGDDVLTYFNTGRHGGDEFTGDHNYFDEALEEIKSRGGIDNILKKNLKKLGVPIK